MEATATVNDEKYILDATAGYSMMWFDKNHSNTIYLDERSDSQLATELLRVPFRRPWNPTTPTEQGDFTRLNYPDCKFKLIVADPPHFTKLGETSIYKIKFGKLKGTWRKDLKLMADELWRVLAPYGVLILKWCDHDIPAKEVVKLFPVAPLFGQTQAGGQARYKGKQNHTFWFCFMKIPEAQRN